MSVDPDYWTCFSPDYQGARRKFRAAAHAARAEFATYAHPTACGPAGEALVIRHGRSIIDQTIAGLSIW